MLTPVAAFLASVLPPTSVPDSGSSAVLFSCGVLATGLLVRFLKNRNK